MDSTITRFVDYGELVLLLSDFLVVLPVKPIEPDILLLWPLIVRGDLFKSFMDLGRADLHRSCGSLIECHTRSDLAELVRLFIDLDVDASFDKGEC